MNASTILFRGIGDFLFPRECAVCGSSGAWLCVSCRAIIPLLTPVCPVCRKETEGGRAHPRCTTWFSLQGLLTGASITLSPVQKLIYGCKYHGLISAADALAALITRAYRTSPVIQLWARKACPILSPIPLHPARERARGYNQAALIADACAKQLSLPSVPLLVRLRPTADQISLTRHARRDNVANCFALKQGIEVPPAVILIDDVVTTGATFDAAARTLRSIRSDIAIWGLAAAYHHNVSDSP